MTSKKYLELNKKTYLNGVLDLDADLQAIESYKEDFLSKKVRKFDSHLERVKFLIEDGYYDRELFEMYTDEEITKIHEIAYDIGFEYKSFMAISKFYESYALKNRDGSGEIFENFEDRAVVNALFFGDGDFDLAVETLKYILEAFQPATPTFTNTGLAYAGMPISCFILSVNDSLNDILMAQGTGAQLSKIGGGVGYVVDNIRAAGEPVRNNHGAAKGPIDVATKLVDPTFRYADQGGIRDGAAVTYLTVMHADIPEFLDTKKISADQDARLVTSSIGIKIPDLVMERAKRNEDYYAFYPRNIELVTGKQMLDIEWTEEFYQELIKNPDIKKRKINAHKLLEKAAIISSESGYPFFFFDDIVNKSNPMAPLGRVISSNLCTEILQTMTPSKYGNYGEKDEIGLDVSCNLASTTTDGLMDRIENIERDMYLAMHALTRVSVTSSVENAPGVKRANEEMRSVGLGLMNFHGYMAREGIKYSSEEAKDLAFAIGYMMNFYTLKASNRLVNKYGAFKHFKKSTYADGSFFDNSPIGKPLEFKTEKVKELFKDAPIPTQEDIDQLKEDVMKYGIANSYRLAVAPTGNISYVRDATPSTSPIASKVVNRLTGKNEIVYPMPYLKDAFWTYEEAINLKVFDIIDVIAELQKNIDQGISLELPLAQSYTTRDRVKIYHYAHHKGLKTLYYSRPLDENSCVSCMV